MNSKLFGPLEEQVMNILWEAEKPLKPQEVLGKLGGDHAYTTIMTVLKRMADKKILKREMCGKAFEYCPCLEKEVFVKKNLSAIYGNLVNDFGGLAISQFVDELKNNKGDLELLKQYVEDSTKSNESSKTK